MPREYDDDDDRMPPIRKQTPSGMDGFFTNTSFPVLILFGVCCSGIAFIVSLIGVFTCTDPTAKKNATTVLIISIVFAVIYNLSYCFSGALNNPGGPAGFR